LLIAPKDEIEYLELENKKLRADNELVMKQVKYYRRKWLKLLPFNRLHHCATHIVNNVDLESILEENKTLKLELRRLT
jgi:hypothetical protein|tara:strand:- start:8927 stop:9160 length:234 start_codon:yes stop_codon:yes gene_type:complete